MLPTLNANSKNSRVTRTHQLFSLVPIQPERFGGRPVADRKQDRVIAHGILVRVPHPRRHDENIALLPGEFIGRYFSRTLATKGVVNRRAGVAVRPGFFLGP